MNEAIILSEANYVANADNASRRHSPSGITLVRTARFLPHETKLNLKDEDIEPNDFKAAESHVVLTALGRKGAPPLAGFLTWRPESLEDESFSHIHHDRAGTPLWRLGYGYVPFNNPNPDEELLAIAKGVAGRVYAATKPALHPYLARHLRSTLHLATQLTDGDFGEALAKSYAAHMKRLTTPGRS